MFKWKKEYNAFPLWTLCECNCWPYFTLSFDCPKSERCCSPIIYLLPQDLKVGPAPVKPDNCLKLSYNKVDPWHFVDNFDVQSWGEKRGEVCRRGGRGASGQAGVGGWGGCSGSKNILLRTLIVSASVLLLLSPRRARDTTENTHLQFPLAPFPLIKLPSQWLIANTDLQPLPLCLLCSYIIHLREGGVAVGGWGVLSPRSYNSFHLRTQLRITLSHYNWLLSP